MTSTFDHLATFYYWTKEMPEIVPLIEAIYDEAIAQSSKVNPKILSWDTWKLRETYTKLHGELGAKAYFLNEVHNRLDHGGYHFKCVRRDLDWLIHQIYKWIERRDDPYTWISIRDLKPSSRKKYKRILDELKKLIKSGFFKCEIIDTVTKRWLEDRS